MAITMQDVRAYLDPEEPNYAAASKLGPAALPLLLGLVRGGDLGLASKATYLASLIKSDRSVEVIEAAAETTEPVLRVAAASALQNLKPAQAERVLEKLKSDPDPGVRKVMVKSAARVSSPRINAVLKEVAQSDPEPFVRKAVAKPLTAPKVAGRTKKPAKKAAPPKSKSGRPTRKTRKKK